MDLQTAFPALGQQVHDGRRLVYLDGAASKLMPASVAQAIGRYQLNDHANVHRGVHALSERATAQFDAARETVRGFVNARSTSEVVFTRGATESLNMVAIGLGAGLRPGDDVIVSTLEHHANLVPWQMACARSGATLRAIPIDDEGELDFGAYEALLSPRTRVVAVTQVSNALGTVVDAGRVVRLARDAGALTVVDGAQAVAHERVDVQALGCDFYAFSGHKMYGPTGIGVLYGREAALEALPPIYGGGDMIEHVTLQESTYARLPTRLEAGTPNISGAIGLAAAIDFVNAAAVLEDGRERDLLDAMEAGLASIDGVRVIAGGRRKQAALSFVIDGVHPHDAGTFLDRRGIAVRTGHHCAMPLMQRLGLASTVRASLSVHNTRDDVDALLEGVDAARRRLS